MAININFSSKYANLIAGDIPKVQLKSQHDSDIPTISGNIPDKYMKPFIHPENGFVKLYCEDYDKPKGLVRRKN